MPNDVTIIEALTAVRARLDQAYARKAEAEREIKELTLALIGIGKEAGYCTCTPEQAAAGPCGKPVRPSPLEAAVKLHS